MYSSALIRGVGAVVIAVGAWAGLVAYVGPTFGYPMPPGSDQAAWDWSASHTWRHLLPGVVAVIGGALLLARSRAGAVAGSVVALLAGIWMIISPFVVRAWLDGGGGGGGGGDASTTMQIITPLGYHHVPGIIVVALSSFVLGHALTARRPADVADDDGGPAPAETERSREREREPGRQEAHV